MRDRLEFYTVPARQQAYRHDRRTHRPLRARKNGGRLDTSSFFSARQIACPFAQPRLRGVGQGPVGPRVRYGPMPMSQHDRTPTTTTDAQLPLSAISDLGTRDPWGVDAAGREHYLLEDRRLVVVQNGETIERVEPLGDRDPNEWTAFVAQELGWRDPPAPFLSARTLFATNGGDRR